MKSGGVKLTVLTPLPPRSPCPVLCGGPGGGGLPRRSPVLSTATRHVPVRLDDAG
jgi:hypothetical protein